jgi:drug/metabolite transporter (DMT)-like permease
MQIIKWIPLFIAGAAIESTTQLCLKKGAMTHKETSGVSYYLKLLRNKWVIFGILAFLVEMVIWVVLLSNIPLSVAFPLSGFQKIFIIMFSVFFLKEKVTQIEWWGIGITVMGIFIIAQAG